ncbi:MAG TPA: ribosome maturation factor RimP [Vicinamibacterales bacterium]|nr:ribosome maturation factor RimP [Vicinamibacterales bacterium]
MTIDPETQRARLRAAAERVARGYGLEIFDVQFRREAQGWVVRVILDRPEPPPGVPEERIGIAECQRVSEDLGAILDVEEEALGLALPEHYVLEVSSPGLDRPLRHEADYRRFTGRLAKLVVREPIDGRTHFAGRLQGVEEGAVVVAEGRRTHRIPLDRIARAHLEVEF